MKKILVCEDESAIRDFVVINLVRAGYDVIEADCGEEALRKYEENNGDIDVALLDVMMPIMDGWQVCREIRKTSQVPIIMITAKGETFDMYDALAAEDIDCKLTPTDDFNDLKNSEIVLITAGVHREEGMNRRDLAIPNAKIVKNYSEQIAIHAPDAIILIATNPVDIMTYVAQKLSGFDKSKVIGSGTTLDSARLRYTLSEKLDVNPKDIHAYVMGEHGDSQFVAWSYALCGVQPIYQIASRKDSKIKFEELSEIEDTVRNIAYEIIKCNERLSGFC